MHIDPAFNSLYLGTNLCRAGSWFEVHDRNANQVVLKKIDTGAFEILSPEVFSKEFLGGEIQIGSRNETAVTLERVKRCLLEDYDARSAREKAQASRRAQYVLRYLDERPHTRGDVDQMINLQAARMGDLQPPCIASVYNWVKLVRAVDGRITALSSVSGRRAGQTSFHPDLARMIDEVLVGHHLRREGCSLSEAAKILNQRMIAYNKSAAPEDQLRPIHRTTLMRYRDTVYHPYDIHRMRFGKAAADRWWHTHHRSPRPVRALEKVQIDSTLVDIILIDRQGRVLGRPWATAAIDVYSRVILAIVIGFAPPSYETVTQCLRMMCMPKGDLAARYGVGHELYYGVGCEIVVDNALEFHSDLLKKEVPERLRVQLTYQPKGEPWWKAMIERWFGTWQDGLVHRLPGTTFSNIAQRGDYDSEGKARVTLEDFRRLTWCWIDEYHHRWHAELGSTPAQVFGESPEGPGRVLSKIKDLDFLLQAVAKPRTISNKGIALHGLWYDSDELKSYRPAPGDERKFEVRYDPADLGAIFVIGGGLTNYLRVPAVWLEYADGLSLHQHRRIQEEIGERRNESCSQEDFLDARRVLMETGGAIFANSASTGRRSKARLLNHPSEIASLSRTSRKPETELFEPPPEKDPLDETRSFSPIDIEVPEEGAVTATVTTRDAPLPTSRVTKSKAAKRRDKECTAKSQGPKSALHRRQDFRNPIPMPDDLDARLDDMLILQKED